MSGETGSFEHVGLLSKQPRPSDGSSSMSTIAVRRTGMVLLATLLAVVAYQTVSARSAKADVRPAQGNVTPPEDEGNSHRPEVASGVKFVKNADGSVTQVR